MWPPNPSRFHTHVTRAICRLFREARCRSLRRVADPTAAGAAAFSSYRRSRWRRRRWRREVRLGRPLACIGRGSWGCGATGRPAGRAASFRRFCGLGLEQRALVLREAREHGPVGRRPAPHGHVHGTCGGVGTPMAPQLPVRWLRHSEAPSFALGFCEGRRAHQSCTIYCSGQVLSNNDRT